MDNPELSTRVCRLCTKSLPLSAFHRTRQNKVGRETRCAKCKSKLMKQKYKDNTFVFTCRLKRAYCKKHGVAFNLTPDYLRSIYQDTCPVFGVKFEDGKKNSYSPSLDRIDPRLGYVQGNVMYISARANRIKYDATVEELQAVLDYCKSPTTIPKGSTPKWVEAADPALAGDDIV